MTLYFKLTETLSISRLSGRAVLKTFMIYKMRASGTSTEEVEEYAYDVRNGLKIKYRAVCASGYA